MSVQPVRLHRDPRKADYELGKLAKRIRRQVLWSVNYLSVVRGDHPRLGAKPTLAAFGAERHVLVSTAGTGHEHQLVERALERALTEEQIVCRVPTFIAAAYAASRTDTVATLPAGVAIELGDAFYLRSFAPPMRLPRIDVSQHWHERFHREPGNQWIRDVFAELFSAADSEVRQSSG